MAGTTQQVVEHQRAVQAMMDERRQAFLDAKAQEETEWAAQVGRVDLIWVKEWEVGLRTWGRGGRGCGPESRRSGPCGWAWLVWGREKGLRVSNRPGRRSWQSLISPGLSPHPACFAQGRLHTTCCMET